MTRFLKFALVWFLALALPVQGFAAATMLCCGSSQNNPASSQSHQSKVDMMRTVDVLSDQAQAKANPGYDLHSDASPASDDDAQHASHAKSDAKGKCSACAASCMSTAIVPDVLSKMPTLEPPGLTVASFYSSQFTAYIPGTPQRPPLSQRL